MLAQQDILRLHVTMNNLAIMRILECRCYLLNIGDYRQWRKQAATRMALAKRAIRGVAHHQERRRMFNAKFQYGHNVGMAKTRNRPCLDEKFLKRFIRELCLHHFNGGSRLKVDVFAQVYVSKATSPKQLDKLVVPQFLSCIVDHLCELLCVPFAQVSLHKQAPTIRNV